MLANESNPISAPIYKRIEADLRSRIRSAVWGPGYRIPGRRELAKSYNVEVNTLQKAMANLIKDGTLRTESGRGTFVAGEASAERGSERWDDTVSDLLAATTVKPARIVGVVGSYRDESDERRNVWNSVILRHMEQVFSGANILVHYADLIENGMPVRSLLETVSMLRSKGAEAIVAAGFFAEDTSQAAWDVVTNYPDMPVVFVTTSLPLRCPVDHVYYDDETASCQAALHLIQKGYHDLAFFSPFTVEWVESRFAGAAAAVRATKGRSITFERHVRDVNLTSLGTSVTFDGDLLQHEEMAYCEGVRLLARRSCPQAVIAANDFVAFGFMRAAREAGHEVGRDYAIIGFDDHALARKRGLSSMSPPLEAMGQKAAGMLIAAMEERRPQGSLCLHSHLMQRQSSLIRSIEPVLVG